MNGQNVDQSFEGSNTPKSVPSEDNSKLVLLFDNVAINTIKQITIL